MFGKNALTKQDLSTDTLWVQEIFPTIQGEGPLAGAPAIFLRLSGCNLKCHFCDTDFESSRLHVSAREAADLILLTKRTTGATLVVITGGEPLLQDLSVLITYLVAEGLSVQIETAGTVWQPNLEDYIENGLVTIVCSPKTGKLNKNVLKYCRDYKYIVRKGENDEEGLPCKSTQVKGEDVTIARPPQGATVWLQPCEEYTEDGLSKLPHKTLENTEYAVQLCMQHNYRLSLQLHKLLNLP